MELRAGQVAVVTGAASGIGLALAERFARAGLHVVVADLDEEELAAAAGTVQSRGVDALAVVTDVRDEQSVAALAAATMERFGAVHVVCNNAGVAPKSDPWSGPLSAWHWVMDVNFWGVVHGVRAFLPTLFAQGEGHIVNTASMAGLLPGFGSAYDASKHAVVAITEGLYRTLARTGLPIGVSVVCPGWVRTQIFDADRHWPDALGERPQPDVIGEVVQPHVRRAIAEGISPAEVADRVAEAISASRFWVFPQQDFLDVAIRRWHTIAERLDPELDLDVPGLPPSQQIFEEVMARLSQPPS